MHLRIPSLFFGVLVTKSSSTLLQNQNGKVRAAKYVTIITQPVFARNCEPTHLTPTVVEGSFYIVPSPRSI